MTISPPAKVKLPPEPPEEPGKVLAWNIDGLTISMELEWTDGSFFNLLHGLKNKAITEDADQPGEIGLPDGSDRWAFNVKAFGVSGYEWLLISRDYTLKVGNWFTPKLRPSLMAEIRSETLWNHGPPGAVARLRKLLESVGARPLSINASRADLCVDVLVPESVWGIHAIDQIVSRAAYVGPHIKNKKFTGITIGSGSLQARIYDKPLEIIQKSKKIWMYAMWGVDSVADDHRILRVEFQHRRESLTSVGIHSVGDLFQLVEKLWAYDSQNWLKLQNGTGPHHTQRKTLPWWVQVQGGFNNSLSAHPVIKAKAIKADAERLCRRAIGDLASLIALMSQGQSVEDNSPISLPEHLAKLAKLAAKLGIDDKWLGERVTKKIAMYQRGRTKYEIDMAARQDAGVASTEPINWWVE